MPWERTWHGDEIQARSDRALGRALIANGELHSRHASVNVHRISGNLARSIHAAKYLTMGEIPADEDNIIERSGVRVLEVGSWIEYACVEENRGGTHSYMQPAHEWAWPQFTGQLRRAFREEGL